MPAATYRGRRAFTIDNADLRVTMLVEGGHVAEILDKRTGVNPLWTPPWPSIEPSAFAFEHHAVYGAGADARLLAGIMGHNVCLDLFGGPSDAEQAAGLPPHGEGSMVPYAIDGAATALTAIARLPLAGLTFERRIELHGRRVRFRERVENLGAYDRPIAWTQHVTLGPPFLEKGTTGFRASATRSLSHPTPFGADDAIVADATFDWPHAPAGTGGPIDLRTLTGTPRSSAYTAHLMEPASREAYFVAWSPAARLAFGYVWRPTDFPWLGIWEENGSRTVPPWNGIALTRGMEFGVSPFPETRRAMIERGRLFGVPTYRWLPARASLDVEYWAVTQAADLIPEQLQWPSFDLSDSAS
jgi:hypothetical protein